MTRTRNRRGVSLVEVLVASTVLIIGLTGITAMLMRGAVMGRNGQQSMLSANFGTQTLGEVTSGGFRSLTPMPGAAFGNGTAADGGIYLDGSGRRYSTEYIVTDLGAPWPTYQVEVETMYTDGTGLVKRTRHTTFLSRTPDAG